MAMEGAAIAEEAGTRQVCQQVGFFIGCLACTQGHRAQITRGSENKGRKATPEVTLSARQKPDQARCAPGTTQGPPLIRLPNLMGSPEGKQQQVGGTAQVYPVHLHPHPTDIGAGPGWQESSLFCCK